MKLFFQKRRSDAPTDEALSGKAIFVRQASHDIKGDFFGVSSICLLLKSTIEKKDDPMPLLQHLAEACEDYKYKLNNFLEYAKFDAGICDTILEPLDIRSLLSDVAGEVAGRAAERAIRIELTIADDLPRVLMSEEFRIKHIAENLLMNAIKFSPFGSLVVMKAEQAGDEWSITVQDSGEGMTAEQLESVFLLSPLHRQSLRTPAGLGLIVTRYLAEDVLKGKLTITSRPRMGTRVSVVLPLENKNEAT